jgi:hypothetical protein
MKAMLRRGGLGLALSLLAHVVLVLLLLARGMGGLTGPVDVELAGGLTEVKDLPLGAPDPGDKPAAEKARKARVRAPRVKEEEGTLGTRPDEEARKGTGIEDDSAPAPTRDLAAYGPSGSRLTVLLRLDRLRGTEYAAPVDDLLMHLPDRRALLQGTGLELFTDFDALLIATPNPRDPAVTFVVARHHLEEEALRAALNRGARAADRPLTWRIQFGRPVGERRVRKTAPALSQDQDAQAGTLRGLEARDDRLVVLAAPKLAVVTPRAYVDLMFKPRSLPDGAATSALPAGDEDGGAAPAPSAVWANLLGRIAADEGLMPPDGVVLIRAVDMWKPAGVPGDAPPVLYGMAVPSEVNGVIGLEDGATVDLSGTFKTDAPARHWELEWPALQRKLRTNPLVMLSGFSGVVARASLAREGNTVRLRLGVSRDEAVRLLTLAVQILTSRGM